MVCREKRIDYELQVEEIFTIFDWVDCEICNKEFRRENLWQINPRVTMTSYKGYYFKFNYCTSCCPTKQDALEAYYKKSEGKPPITGYVTGYDIKKMSVKEFRKKGYLQEINRCFLHPLGLALDVLIHDDGSESFGGIWDYREDPEGFFFSKSTPTSIDVANRIQKEKESKIKNRVNNDSIKTDANGIQSILLFKEDLFNSLEPDPPPSPQQHEKQDLGYKGLFTEWYTPGQKGYTPTQATTSSKPPKGGSCVPPKKK